MIITINTGSNGIHEYVSLNVDMPFGETIDRKLLNQIMDLILKYNDDQIKHG